MINIVLVEPRIPQNTGNIGRLALACGARLHLIYPLEFIIDSREVRRAGMDYFHKIDLIKWENLQSFWQEHKIDENHFFFTTKASKSLFDATFGDECFLYFGREDRGLDSSILEANEDKTLRIPMFNDARSLNLSNSVSIAVYEVIRQNLSKQ